MSYNEFHTLKGYQLNNSGALTASMEDYLEMICRLGRTTTVVRIHELSGQLHVKPSSASKMVQNLRDAGYVEFPRYGYILPTEKGLAAGAYLLHRHKVLHNFLCLLNGTDDELEQVEKIEHFINKKTLGNLEKLVKKLKNNNDILK